MSEAAKFPNNAPPLAARDLDDILPNADQMLCMMAGRSLPEVAELAGLLANEARAVGATDIARAAERMRQAAVEHNAVALARPMRRLAEAIAAERRRHGGEATAA